MKIAPNEQCSCGSGRKNKRCCQRRGVNGSRAFFYYNLGVECDAKGQRDMAMSLYQKALAFNPDFVHAYNNLGANLKEKQRFNEALYCYEKTLVLNPEYLLAYINQADVLNSLGRFEEAVAANRRALEIGSESPQVYNNMGISFLNKGDYEEAKEFLRKSLAIDPDNFEAYHVLGNVMMKVGDLEKALDCYRKSLAIAPGFADAHNSLARPLLDRGRHEEAISCMEKAVSLAPDNPGFSSNVVMFRQYAASGTSEEVFAAALEYGRAFEKALGGQWKGHGNIPDPEKRLKVGILSGDLRRHPVGFFLEGIIPHLKSDSIALYAYANQYVFDELGGRIKPHFEKWAFVLGDSDETLASLIRDDGIDVLIELTGHTANNRLPALTLKPAPVQVTWLGYPNTTGLKSIDYIIADPVTLPQEEEKYYTEKALRLPESYICYEPPQYDLAVQPPPVLENDHVTFGSFNSPAKINDEVIAAWARILSLVPGSRLFMKYNKVFDWETERDHFRGRFSQAGIDPGRIDFEGYSSRRELFAAYHRVDIALDPFPYTGATTTCEALWMGVPTLTLKMPRGIVAHNGELMMGTVGCSDWVAGSVNEYVAKAGTFAEDPAGLAELRPRLRPALLASPLGDTRRFALNLEAGLRGIWREWCLNNSH